MIDPYLAYALCRRAASATEIDYRAVHEECVRHGADLPAVEPTRADRLAAVAAIARLEAPTLDGIRELGLVGLGRP